MVKVSIEKDWQRCADFHGHECPGLAIGFRAAHAGLEWLENRRSVDEELVTVVENDACGVDAVQVLTGCTFGKGNLIHLDHGKQVFTFFERDGGRGLRLSLRHGAIEAGDRQRELMDRAREGRASAENEAELGSLRRVTMDSVLNKPLDELFEVSEPTMDIPSKASVQRSELCAQCHEPTMPSKMVEVGGKRLCRACAP